MRKLGCSAYFADLWHPVELVNIFVSLLAILFFVLRTLEVIDRVEFLKNNRGMNETIINFPN